MIPPFAKLVKTFTFIFIICFTTNSNQLFAQDSEIGFWLGTSTYFGDLNPGLNPKNTRPAGGLVYRYHVNPHIALKGSVGFGRIKHEDSSSNSPFQQARNLSFKSNILEATGQVELNFFKYIPGDSKHYATPYITSGIGFFYFNPKAELDGETYELQPLGTEGQAQSDFTQKEPYKRFQLSIPVGLGFKYWTRGAWNFYAEAGYRLTFTDYIDDVSDVYVDQLLLGGGSTVAGALADRSNEVNDTGAIGQAGRQRGDKVSNDGYLMVSLGLTYTLFNRKCIQAK